MSNEKATILQCGKKAQISTGEIFEIECVRIKPPNPFIVKSEILGTIYTMDTQFAKCVCMPGTVHPYSMTISGKFHITN